ncbi:MAG: DUF4493 domain-containing protein [Alistipes sp.]|nr:DUF4493 domain-containing protein [Alistipes sp.]
MNKFVKYIFLAGVAMLAAACEQEPISADVEGSVNFRIQMSSEEARAVNAGDFTPETLKVRIYREDGQLIRRYTSMAEIPEQLYLVAGEYSVKVEGGDANNTAFKEPATELERKQLLNYLGQQPFTVTAHQNKEIEVNCPTINSKFNVGFDTSDSALDETGRRKYENRLLSNVKITVAAVTTDATTVADYKTAVADAKAPKLEFDATGAGYFLMPEGVTTLVWSFEATHATDGAVAQVGKVSNIQPGKAYTVNYFYSRTPDGFAGITVFVDDTVDEIEDDFDFKPQPEISGSGIDLEGVNLYLSGNTVSLVCESINDLTKLTLGGVTFFENGAVVPNAITGLTASSTESTKVSLTLSAEYFASLHGAVQDLQFAMTDTEGEYMQILHFKKRGLLIGEGEQSYDLWNNTATISAYVPESGVSNVVIRYHRAGSDVWHEMTPSVQADGAIWTGTTTASWGAAVQNRNGHTIYKPDTALGIYADTAYEYVLVVDGVESDRYTLTPTVSQTIPYATFEDSSLACYGNDTGVAPFWGSGNNSFTNDDPLCRFATYAGMQGAGCARLSSCAAGAFGVTMLAAGNLFTGTFNKPSTTGTVQFGVNYNWKARPTALKLKVWHQLGTVDRDDKSAGKLAKGSPDEASILVAIMDWSTRHKVTSGTGSPTGMWSPEDGPNAVSEGTIIGYGVAYPTGTSSESGMVDYEIPIVYYNTTTKPSANYTLVISAATSRYGDYMNGCSNSNMYMDDFRWSYASSFERTFPATTF